MKRIAITGGIGEGKSTVLRFLRELGYGTASADDVARQFFEEPLTQAKLAEILEQSPPVSPDVLRRAIATQPEVRRAVNRFMHPGIRARLAAGDAPFVEVPLLIETCLQDDFDRIWVVTCGREEQLIRLGQRIGADQAQRLIATQLPTRVKEAFADHVIRTNKPESFVFEEVRKIAASVVCE
jgi:dephospho-CoA kinase